MFEVTKEFPKSETYSLTDQVRRSSRAVGAIVAEAWARRRYKGAFINKLNMAMAEAHETQSWLDHARTCGYIDDETYADLDDAWQHVGAMSNKMIQNADTFCEPDSENQQRA